MSSRRDTKIAARKERSTARVCGCSQRLDRLNGLHGLPRAFDRSVVQESDPSTVPRTQWTLWTQRTARSAVRCLPLHRSTLCSAQFAIPTLAPFASWRENTRCHLLLFPQYARCQLPAACCSPNRPGIAFDKAGTDRYKNRLSERIGSGTVHLSGRELHTMQNPHNSPDHPDLSAHEMPWETASVAFSVVASSRAEIASRRSEFQEGVE